MDFHSMRRKQLQALCKKHGIPANKTNLEMAELLASTLKVSGSENSVKEAKDEEEVEEGVVVDGDNKDKKKRKVRFSPDVETREYEPSVHKGRGGRVCRKRNAVDFKQNKVVKSGIVRGDEELEEVGNKRGLGKTEEEVLAKKIRVNKGGIRGRRVAASEEKSEFQGTSDELGEEGLVGRTVSRRNSVKNDEKKGVVGSILESEEKVSLEIETLQGMKRKELQSLCKKHGIPANKTNLEMARLLAATLKVSQETGTLQRSGSAIHVSERTEPSNEEEPSGDNEAGCLGELVEEETVIQREETMLATEAASTETISLVKQPIQGMKLGKPQVSKRVKRTKKHKGRSNRDLGDGLDGLSDAKEDSDNAQCVEENQDSTPVIDELPTSQTKIITCSSANEPGLEKEMEVEELWRGKDSQHENRDFNDHLAENDCIIQVESDVHLSLDVIEAQIDHEAIANLELVHDESDALGRTLDSEEISSTVQETKDNERDIGLILSSNNNELEQVELSGEKEGNNGSIKGAYEEALHPQNCGDCSAEIREESKDILDGVNHNDCETISQLDIPEDISKELMDQKEKKVLESDCSVDAAQVMDVISSEDIDVDCHAEELTVQDENLGCATQVEIVGGKSYKEVSPRPRSEGETGFNQTSCDEFEVSRMEIVDSAMTPDAEFPAKTLNSENVEVQDGNDSGNKEVASYLNENSDEKVSQDIHDESNFSEQWSVEQLEEKETESEFGNSQVSDFTQSVHANLVEGELADKHEHCEDICEINGEEIDNGTHTESPKTLRTQQSPNRSSSSPCMLGLLFPDEGEEFTETQSAAPEILFDSSSEDSKDPIGTSETVNNSLEINPEKSGRLDNFKNNSIEVNEDLFVDSENVISGNIKPEDAMEIVENMDELAEELSSPLALTSNKKEAKQCFTGEIPVYSKSYGKSEMKSIDTFSELKDLPFHDAAELKNEASYVPASAFVGGNEKYNGEEPTIDALQESRSNDYVSAMPITENVTDLERLETTVVEKQLGNASPIDKNESIHAGDEISNELHNVSANKSELTKQVRDNIKNVSEHRFAIEGMSMEASVGATVDDKLNSYPEVDSIDTKGAIDASNEKHDSANLLSEIDDVVNEGFLSTDINISTPSELTYEDKSKGCVMGTNEAPLYKPNVEDSVASQNKETKDVEGFHLISSSKCDILDDSFAFNLVNASHHDREQEVGTTATDAQQLSLMNKDVMEIQENSKMNTQTAGELENQHGENVYSAEEEVAEHNMSNSHDVSELLHIEENEHSSMQDNLPLSVDEIQGPCSSEIQEESVKAETKKDNFSGRLGVNEQFISEDVQPNSSELDQSFSCINAAVNQETTIELEEDQHGQNVHLEEDVVVEAKMCSHHDVSESLHVDEIKPYDLPLKDVEIQGSYSPETDKDENVKAENNPVNSENNEFGGLVDVSTEILLSEHVPELPSSARNQSISPLNSAVAQGTGDENNVESEHKLPSAETTSLIAKQEHPIAKAKQLISPAMKSKNRRTVLIHGTPKRVFESSEMKENIHSTKMKQAGHLTAQRALPKRRALEDLRKI